MGWLTALFGMIQSGFNFFEAREENQMPRDVIKDKKSKSRACNYAERIFKIVDKYPKDNWEEKDIKKYNRLRERFDKVD